MPGDDKAQRADRQDPEAALSASPESLGEGVPNLREDPGLLQPLQSLARALLWAQEVATLAIYSAGRVPEPRAIRSPWVTSLASHSQVRTRGPDMNQPPRAPTVSSSWIISMCRERCPPAQPEIWEAEYLLNAVPKAARPWHLLICRYGSLLLPQLKSVLCPVAREGAGV